MSGRDSARFMVRDLRIYGDWPARRPVLERYFPNASHQVLILSTDTEVDRQYYDALQASVSHAFHLNYDERERSTLAEEGYSWAT